MPIYLSGRPDACLVVTLSPGLKNSLRQNDIDSGVMTCHRDEGTHLAQFKCLIRGRTEVSLLGVEAIEDGGDALGRWLSAIGHVTASLHDRKTSWFLDICE